MLISFFLSAGQDVESDIDWYKGFFNEVQKKSVDEALQQAGHTLQEATDVHDFKAQSRAHKTIGLIHLTRTRNYEEAMNSFIQSLAIEDSLGLIPDRILTYVCMAQVFEEVGDYYKSAEILESGLDANRKINSISIHILILNKLGKINAELGKMEEAFASYEHVLQYTDQLQKPDVEAEAFYHLGNLYVKTGKYAEALQHHKDALALYRSLKNKREEARSLNDIGELYRLMRNQDRALANHVAALEIRQGLRDKATIAESYNNIGVLYFHAKNYQRAAANLQLALSTAQENQDQEQIRRSYEYLSRCFKETGDYKRAFEYNELFMAINDFIQRDKGEQELLEKQSRYIIEKREAQITKLESDRVQREKELANQRKIRNFLLVLMVMTLVIGALILYLYMLKRRSNKILEVAHAQLNTQNLELLELNATKDKFFSIISHDLKGPLNSLTSFSGLLINHAESLSKEEIQMLAKDLDKSLKNLFSLLENLLEWSRSQTGKIEFKPESFNLTKVLEGNAQLLQTQALNKKISIVNNLKNECMVWADYHSIDTVVRNLISNAIKFTPEQGIITLDAQRKEQDVIVTIADTGVGMSSETIQKLFRIDAKHSTKGTAEEKGTGLGLILCKEFIEKNGGRIWVESTEGKGSVFYFAIPATQ
ncbi:MAG: tetratricopeptide repeat-containing sensor histidine kinase [Cyclobacteriaceae bacterium]|nr:tetratricopeptide repeat-containing sensor histidine kinase [Cyclobacteriaceae bacterium]